jgi:23S rRNA (guanosine2251-2'-O)-methyltransferase
VLVIGAEGRGLSRLIAQRCDEVARIPISGAESLNASVAAGIALYAVARRRA